MQGTSDRPKVVTFRRHSFYGDFANQEPKWHIAQHDGGKWGTYIAWCKYTKSNILGDLSVSRSKTPKTVNETCARCLKALAKAEAEAIRQGKKLETA